MTVSLSGLHAAHLLSRKWDTSGPSRTRTDRLLCAKQALFQMSYGPIEHAAGVEPTASTTARWRSAG